MGEQISVTHTTDGRLSVEGLAETPKRKQELLDALSALRSNPAVKIDIQTLDEALARQPKGQNSSGSISIETSQPSSNTLPVDKELRQRLVLLRCPPILADWRTTICMRKPIRRLICDARIVLW